MAIQLSELQKDFGEAKGLEVYKEIALKCGHGLVVGCPDLGDPVLPEGKKALKEILEKAGKKGDK